MSLGGLEVAEKFGWGGVGRGGWVPSGYCVFNLNTSCLELL